MPRLRVYLDTSVISHLFHDDTPQRKAETEEFFENTIAPRMHDPYISVIVLDELGRTRDVPLRKRFLDTVSHYELSILPPNDPEVRRLAQVYIERRILPSKKPEDALHVAYATVFEMDVLATWNFRHLARVQTASLISGTNIMEGYAKPLKLLTPLELLAP